MSDEQQSLAEYVNALGDTNHRAAQEYCDLIREIRSLKEQQQWIPVSEYLAPEDGELVDVWITGQGRKTDYYVTNHHLVMSPSITHVMPLPQPPTAEEE